MKAGLHSPNAFVLRRCLILLLSSATGKKKSAYNNQIASELGCNSQTMPNAIHKFDEDGLK